MSGTWHEPLGPSLLNVLEQEAFALASERRARAAVGQPTDDLDVEWAWRMLPRGALVAARLVVPAADDDSPLGHYEVRVARRSAPEDDRGWDAWHREVNVLQDKINLQDPPWRLLPQEEVPDDCRPEDGVVAVWRERTGLDALPEKA